MTREEAYYERLKLLSGEWDSYDEWLNGHLEIEDPLSDIVLELIDCRDDMKEVEYRLNLYCQEKPFDEESVYERFRTEIFERYEKGEMNTEDVVSGLYRVAKNLPFCDFYLDCSFISDYYDLVEEGIIRANKFDLALKKWLIDGEPIKPECLWDKYIKPKPKNNKGFRRWLKKVWIRLKKDKNIKVCDECGSEYLASKSKMASLCPECAHVIYGYENCNHVFENGKCTLCLWDGSQSEYIKSLKDENKQ